MEYGEIIEFVGFCDISSGRVAHAEEDIKIASRIVHVDVSTTTNKIYH